MPCPKTQHRNNVPRLRGEKHYISLKILHQPHGRQQPIGKAPRSNHCAMSLSIVNGRGPRVVVSTAAFYARVRVSVPGLGGLKEITNVSSPYSFLLTVILKFKRI